MLPKPSEEPNPSTQSVQAAAPVVRTMSDSEPTTMQALSAPQPMTMQASEPVSSSETQDGSSAPAMSMARAAVPDYIVPIKGGRKVDINGPVPFFYKPNYPSQVQSHNMKAWIEVTQTIKATGDVYTAVWDVLNVSENYYEIDFSYFITSKGLDLNRSEFDFKYYVSYGLRHKNDDNTIIDFTTGPEEIKPEKPLLFPELERPAKLIIEKTEDGRSATFTVVPVAGHTKDEYKVAFEARILKHKTLTRYGVDPNILFKPVEYNCTSDLKYSDLLAVLKDGNESWDVIGDEAPTRYNIVVRVRTEYNITYDLIGEVKLEPGPNYSLMSVLITLQIMKCLHMPMGLLNVTII
jgi:hypothetical protein